ncbi:hypothetical protein M407DRAFT_229820 [Tulasnella calospora MUT 4182]|uniref:Carrier domain-containing protein n=1 Tax=Tulasnella calospora MUT 4182 TaxID=1051891 RepID=A0A0C3QCX6_9AGAM|nr:hypothetical protein M407DRAFT_229820 [Tulasnella calospora MUT 4182]
MASSTAPERKPASPMYASLRDILIKRADEHPDNVAVNWIDTTGSVSTSITYGELSHLAFSLARYMKNHGVEVGDRVAILDDRCGPELFVAFFACQVLSAVPVPVPCPSASSNFAAAAPQILSIMEELKPDTILVPPRVKDVLGTVIEVDSFELHREPESLEQSFKRVSRLGVFVVDPMDDTVGGKAFDDEQWEGEEGDGLAYIQFTSGTDSDPKGIFVSHAAALTHLATFSAIGSTASQGSSTKRVGLVAPPSFDRSLIIGALGAIYEGGTSFLVDIPRTGLSSNLSDAIQGDPLAYFRLLSDHQMTSALVPQALFLEALEAWKQLPVERRPKLSAWDLSKCTQLVSYGGSISGEVGKEIRELLKPAGLPNVSFDTIYGLSGYPLAATASLSTSPASHNGTIYAPCSGMAVKIVDPVTREELPDGFQGEIWIDGPGMPVGFLASTDEEDSMGRLQDQAYLRTGDLGVIENSKFTISGRLSDSFNINGKTFFVPEIENVVSGYHGVSQALLLPFPPDTGSTRPSLVLLLALETRTINHMSMFDHRGTLLDLCIGLYRRVSALKAVKLTNILIFAPDALPKTITGKFAKAAARSLYLRAEVPQKVYQWDLNLESVPPTPREELVLSPLIVTPERPDARFMLVSCGAEVFATDTSMSNTRGMRDLVRRQWKMVLQVPIDDADDFYGLGGSLAQGMRITYAVRKVLKCPQIGIHHLIGSRTFAAYAETALRVARFDDSEEAHQELHTAELERSQWLWDQVVFPEDFKALEPRSLAGPSTPRRAEPAEGILLLGATTALGSFILAELLNSDRSTVIHCVVDAETEEAARAAVVSALKKHILWRAQWPGRIIPVAGRPYAKRFGLGTAAFQTLANEVKLVIHASGAGDADLLGPYTLHEKEMVSGTKEAIRLALSSSNGVPIPVHFVSSLDVFDDAHYAQELEAHHPPLHSRTPGKARAHWVVEQLVLKASRDYRLPAAVYRVGSLLGHSSTGASFALDGPISVILDNLHRTKKAPQELLDVSLPFTTVDYAAKAIVTSALAPPPRARSQLAFYHVLSTEAYPFHRAVEVFESVTGESANLKAPVALQDWLLTLEECLPADLVAERGSLLRNANQDPVALEFAALASALFSDTEGIRALGGPEEVSTVQMQDRLRRLGFSIDRTIEEVEVIDRALAVSIKWAGQEAKRRRLKAEADAAAALKQEQMRAAVQTYSKEKQSDAESDGSTIAGAETVVAVAQPRHVIGDVQRLREWILRTPSLAFLTVLLWAFLGQ